MIEDVIITSVNSSFLRIETDQGFEQTLNDYYSFYADNYQWSPKFKNKFWDGKIRLFQRQFGLLPAGLKPDLINFLEENQKTWSEEGFSDIPDRDAINQDFDRFLGAIKLPENYEVRDYQRQAVIDAILEKRGIILSPTGSGKSLIIYLLVRYLRSRGLSTKRTLVIVPTINLVTQLVSDFEDYASNDPGFDPSSLCHQIIGGKDKTSSKPIWVSTWQSLMNVRDKDYFKQFDLTICDEVHTAEAKEITSIIQKSENAYYKIGLTGTLKEMKINPLQLIGLFGKIIKTRSTAELMDEGILTRTPIMAMVLDHSEESRKTYWNQIKEYSKKKETKKVYQFEMRHLFEMESRNLLIAKLLRNLAGMNTLILFRSVEHTKATYDLLKRLGFDVHWMSANLGPEDRERIRKYAESRTDVIILSTFQIFQLGINIKNLHNAIFAAPAKGRIRVLQSFGRLLRHSPDGRVGYLFDLIDDIRQGSRENISYKHGLQRLEYYAEEQLQVKYKAIKI